MGAPRRGAGIDQDGHLWLQRKRPCLYTAPPIGAAGIRSPAPSLTSEDSAGPPALNPAAKMSQTTYYLPVTFARPQDPSTRSDAPAAGGSPQAPSANGGEAVANGGVNPSGQQPAPCANDGMLWMMPAFLVIMYFFMIRPEQKRKKEQQNLLASIKQGDQVVTISGMHGEVAALTDKTVTLRVDTVNVTFDRSAVARIERDLGADGAATKS